MDAPAITAFLERIFGSGPEVVAPHLLHWKCWERRPDWVGSRSYVITNNEVIVAHGAVVPLSYVDGERRLRMLHLIDWAADRKSVGSGITLLNRIAQMV